MEDGTKYFSTVIKSFEDWQQTVLSHNIALHVRYSFSLKSLFNLLTLIIFYTNVAYIYQKDELDELDELRFLNKQNNLIICNQHKLLKLNSFNSKKTN